MKYNEWSLIIFFFHSLTILILKTCQDEHYVNIQLDIQIHSISKGTRRISYRLLNFIRNHYDLEELNIRWLCPKCQRVETEIMNREYGLEEENNMNTSSEELSEDDSTDNEKDDSGSDQQDSEEKQSDDEILLELTYRQEQAMEQLSAVFKLLKMDPVHDK
jgi:hypothetical protein